jgi:hypothetical protein
MAEALSGDGPPDRELLIAIQKRHGLTPAPPASRAMMGPMTLGASRSL